jgi:hypothetical protein
MAKLKLKLRASSRRPRRVPIDIKQTPFWQV